MYKALIATIMVALLFATTAAAFGPPTLAVPGITNPWCAGQNNAVTCHRQDMHGYSIRITTSVITVGKITINKVTHRYVTNPVVFTHAQLTGNASVASPNEKDGFLYAGIFCQQDPSDNGIMCVPNSMVGYGVDISSHHVVVLNVATGQTVFSKVVP